MMHCNRCKQDLAGENFGVRRNGRRQQWCRTCVNDYNKKWYSLNREKHKEYVSSHKPRKVHTCKHCGLSEPEVSFYIKREGNRSYRRFICSTCDIVYRKKYPRKEDAKSQSVKRSRARRKVDRTAPELRYKYIYTDSRRSDKVHGRENDLDKAFIKSELENGCIYCGDTNSYMTLDRIDNYIGHLKSNVLPACVRCNYIRRDMPALAWAMIVPGVRRARELGYLDGWHCGTRSNKPNRDMSRYIKEIEDFHEVVPEPG
jgi:hypothetical protein